MKPLQNKLKLVQVLLVYYCNLSCEYCYQDFSKVELKKMTLGTFKDILSKLDGETNIDLNLFGGEPLLNKEIMSYVMSDDFVWIDAIDIISINTNGVYMDPQLIDFAEKYKDIVRIDLSVDGNKQIHDYYRKDASGKGSYDVIEKNILRINDFSNYNINFCVSSYASDKLFDGVQKLVSLGFRKIKLMFLYENYWPEHDLKNLCRELMRLKVYMGTIDINIFHPYDDGDQECRNDFLETSVFLPSGELIPCPVWISKQSSKVVPIKPFAVKSLKDKKEIIEEKVFGNQELSSIMDTGAICESIQGSGFTRNKKIIESLISKVLHHE